MSNKIYCGVSNHLLAENVSNDKLNYFTYVKLLEYFDEVHIYGRTFDNKSFTKKHCNEKIFIHYVSVPKLYFFRYLFSIFKIFRIILKDHRKYNFSLFDASEPTTGGIICSGLIMFIKKPYVLQIQGELTRISGKNIKFIKSVLTKYITLLAIRFSGKVRSVSHVVKEQLVNDGVSPYKIDVIPARVNLSLFDYKQYPEVNLRKEFGIDNGKKLFLFVGRLVEGKGVDYLIQALEVVNKNKYHVLIIGDGEYMDTLIRLTEKLKLTQNITYLGKVEFIKIPYYMVGVDYLILPTLNEGFGRVILESMAMKTPVIASNVGGIQDILVDSKTGFFIKTGDINNIRSVIEFVLNLSENEYSKIVEKSYETVVEKYEFNYSMNLFLEFYDKAINEYENS